MTTLITAAEGARGAGMRLSRELQAHVDELGCLRVIALEEAAACLPEADSVVLVHGEPFDSQLAFVDHSRTLAAGVPVLVWGAPRSSDLVVEYLVSGAKACFLAGDEPDSLLAALPVVRGGGHYLPPVVQRMLLRRFVEVSSQVVGGLPGPYNDPDGLTEREREVLELLADGLTNPEIAERLFLEVGTIKNHVHHILSKLNVPDRQSAARYFQTRQCFTPSQG